ncbi:MmpS family transport accessory protein, partial [Mycobacterium ulcerans]
PPPPPPPPPPSTEIPTATETQTVTVTPPPPPPPPPETSAAPPPAATTPTTPAAAPPPTTTTPAGPRQVTYSVTGTKAPGDIISVTYVDASGRRRTQHNVYIPWSMTVTPISQSDVGSVEASSLFRVSRLNCSITTSDGTVLSSNSNDAPQTSC